jgi:hypothetical protein
VLIAIPDEARERNLFAIEVPKLVRQLDRA